METGLRKYYQHEFCCWVGGNANQCNYSASKAGMIGFTKSIAKELGVRNIRCNAVAPGFIITDMTGQLPEEIVKGWYEKFH